MAERQHKQATSESKAKKAPALQRQSGANSPALPLQQALAGNASPRDILDLQQAVGNRATRELLQGQRTAGQPRSGLRSQPGQPARSQAPPVSASPAQTASLQKAGLADKAMGVVTSQLLAQASTLVSQISDQAYGPLTPLAKAGLQGFIKRLAAVPAMKLIKMAKKLFAALQSPQYLLGYLIGLLKGFFFDGLAGIFILIYDLAKLAIKLPLLGYKLAKRLGAPLISAMATDIGGIGQWISENAPTLAASLLQELGGKGGLSGAVAQIAAYLMTKARGAASKIGGKMAAGLMSFLGRSKGAIGRALGEVAGRLSGAVLFEIILAVITSGGGSAITALKTALRAMLGLFGKIGRGFLKVAARLAKLLGWAIRALKGWILALANTGPMKTLSSKLAELFGKLGKFVKTVVGRLTGAGKAGKASKRGRPAASATTQPGPRPPREGLPAPASLPRAGAVPSSFTSVGAARTFVREWLVVRGRYDKLVQYFDHRYFVEHFRSLAGKAREIPVAFTTADGKLVVDLTRVDIPGDWLAIGIQKFLRRRGPGAAPLVAPRPRGASTTLPRPGTTLPPGTTMPPE